MSITEISGYRIVRSLGAGGMGQVFLVEHPRLPRHDALKLLDEGISRNDEFKARFDREADLLARLSHPNIVTLHDRGEYEGRLWIAMEFVDGTDAGRLLASSGRLPMDLVHRLVNDTGSALDHAWRKQQITHRDVKPANILLGFDGTGPDAAVETVKLADFGIAKAAEESTSLTSTGIAVGTLAYISPEAIEGRAIDNRSDIYSLGCTAFHLLTGRSPFSGSSVTALMSAHLHGAVPPVTDLAPDLPTALDPVFRRVLAKDPNARYQSCADFVSALSDAMNGVAPVEPGPAFAKTVSATAFSPTALETDRSRPSADRRLWLTLFTTACILAAIAITGAVFYLSNRSAPPTAVTVTSPPQTTTVTRTLSSSPAVSSQPPVIIPETTPTEEPITVAAPVVPEPYEGQPCGPDQFNEHSADGTLYCSAMNGAWTDLTHQSRPAVEAGSPCSEPGARARVARTDGIATCKAGPDGTLGWNW
ncbi:MAG: protein kinase [Gordonia sp. (in: high G+C Gram-positive bacteria)]|uniref:serine/threonine-protein kinase n=1 Tax=Gordonia sp. (in: high G+C Gram-positive bacteria) TaxID=84139 RepID=UPI003C750573